VSLRVAILTVSDSVASGRRADRSGAVLTEYCKKQGWEVVWTGVVADDRGAITDRLAELCDREVADVVLTTGGTGLGPRDVTPEATRDLGGRPVAGLVEWMRLQGARQNPRAVLSRAEAVVRGSTLVVNLPGSPRGAVESLESIAGLLPHAVEILRGGGHPETGN
jgi:molybdenum cofactor synthesis domain-containing protein